MRPMSLRYPRSSLAFAVAALALVAGACGSSSSSSSSTAGNAGAGSTTTLPAVVKVGPDPSVSAKMVCGTEGQAVIAAALNENPTKITTPTWIDHVYACTYVYKAGTMGVSVKELSTAAETTAYFKSLQQRYGLKETFELGQGAFISPQGIVVARKDYKVLTIDPLHLPSEFGNPPTSRGNVSIGAADALMGCWTGA